MKRLDFLCACVGTAALAAPIATHAQARPERWTLAGATIEARAESGGVSIRVGTSAPQTIGRGAVRVERFSIGSGEALVVRVEGEQPGAALVAGSSAVPPSILYAAPSVSMGEDVADRVVTEVRTIDEGGRRTVVIGERRNESSLCGLGAPLVATRALDATSLRLVARAVDPFSVLPTGATPANPVAIAAVPVEPSARNAAVPALVAQGQSAGGAARGPAFELFDRRANTQWSGAELDFVVARVIPATVPIERVILTVPAAPAALPRALSIVLGAQRYDVTIAPGLAAAGGRVAVPIVPARASGCLALVIRAPSSAATAAIAEVSVASSLDREADPLGALARQLDGEGADGAAQALSLVGTPSIAAIAAALPSLRTSGARRAVRVLSSLRTPAAAEALVVALAREDTAEVAREAIVRMGEVALEALSRMVATDSRAADALLVVRAPRAARAAAILPALGAEREVWRRARGPLVSLLREASDEEQRGWLASLPASPARARLRGLAALMESARSEAVREAVSAASLATPVDAFAERYLQLASLSGSAEGRRAIEQGLAEGRDADLRHEAVRSLGTLARAGQLSAVRPSLERATSDRAPRVRAAAVAALAADHDGRVVVARVLGADSWPSVRAAAVEALTGQPDSVEALYRSLDDMSVLVVRAGLASLERTQAPGVAGRLVAFARDPRRNPVLRIDALGAVGARCDRSVALELERLVLSQIDSALPDGEQAVGHAALAALAKVDIQRARAVLERMDANAAARNALEAAGRNACR